MTAFIRYRVALWVRHPAVEAAAAIYLSVGLSLVAVGYIVSSLHK
jgi:hypothetical protein